MRIWWIALASCWCLTACAGASDAPQSQQTAAAGAVPLRTGSYYVEFRARLSVQSLPGHTYLVYGPQDGAGRPLEQHIVGFYPEAGPIGLIAGLVGFPGAVGQDFIDDFMPVMGRYRRNLTPDQYAKLLQFIADQQKEPHVWSMFFNNCNDWAAEAATAIGLNVPAFRDVPPSIFVMELGAANS